MLALLAGVALLAATRDARAQTTQAPFTVMAATGAATALVGEQITFAVIAPEPGKDYVWSFGDGSRPMTGARIMHTYADIDDYTVELAVNTGGAQARLGAQTVRVAPEFRGAFGSDLDGQFTPADLFQMAVAVRAPGLTTMGVRTSGTLIGDRATQFDITGGEDFLVLPEMTIADERNPIIRDELVRKPSAAIPMQSGVFTLALDYTTKSGKAVSLSLTPPVRDFFNPERTLAVTYPEMFTAHGLPPEGQGEDRYYLLGDADFTHPTDFYVRMLALEFGRRGAPWSDDPRAVAMNIFRTIDALLADADPGEFNNDFNLARLFNDGSLSKTRKNGEYICIGQAFFFNALARTLGFPAREINNAIGEAVSQRADGVWRVRWWQEAGAELWFNDQWNYFDTYLGLTDRQAYLAKNLIFQSWAGFNRQATEFRTVGGVPTGLKGHNFNNWPGDPPHFVFIEEGVRPGIVVEGTGSDAPVTFVPGAITFDARPPAAGISELPVLARPTMYDLMGRPGATP